MTDVLNFSDSEIITYMENTLVKTCIGNTGQQSEKYFDIEIRKKKYPSCYQYNILVMLAKRLITETDKKCNYRWELDKTLAEKIVSD